MCYFEALMGCMQSKVINKEKVNCYSVQDIPWMSRMTIEEAEEIIYGENKIVIAHFTEKMLGCATSESF